MARKSPAASTAHQVLKAVKAHGRGYVFTPHDFLSLGTRRAVDHALSALAGSGTIRRLARGIYDYPKISPRLGPLTPTAEVIAAAFARRDLLRLQVSGARAANALGLSTQVPARATFLTEGTPRSRRVGKQLIEFRRAVPRRLHGAGTTAGAVVQALRDIGPEHVEETVAHLLATLSAEDKRELEALLPTAPIWMHAAIRRVTASDAGAASKRRAPKKAKRTRNG
jgi:hypothetical protein